MTFFFKFACSLIFLTLGLGCDSENSLVREFIGENGEFFHAKINGKDWYPQTSLVNFGPSLPIQLFVAGEYFSMSVFRSQDPQSHLDLKIDQFNGVGTYTLADSSAHYYITDPPGKYYYTTDTHSGTIEITDIDTVKRLVSGRVSFDAISGNEVIQLRDGKFKAHL